MCQNMNIIAPEASIAARWWSEQLKSTTQDIGAEAYEEVIAQVLLQQIGDKQRESLTPEFIAEFERLLRELIHAKFINNKDWIRAKTQPMWGTYHRTISVDYGADNILRAAYQAAGGEHNPMVFPIKTCMWVNPGSVKVRLGYCGEEVELFEGISESGEYNNES